MSSGQAAHRYTLLSYFSIPPGSRVLELGCGQGDTTEVLASLLGPHGHITALDPAPPTYGSPLTLSEAQALIKKNSELGSIITFHNSTSPLAYLSSYTGPPYDFIIMVHCTWYFSSAKQLSWLVDALRPHVTGKTKLCIAEWSLRVSEVEQVPHLLTAFLRASLESKRNTPSSRNIRTAFSPAQIIAAVTSPNDGGKPLQLISQKMEGTNEGMLDAYWEVSDVLRRREKEVKLLRENGVSEGEVVVLEGFWDSILSAVEALGGVERVRSMDFWVGVFGRG